MRNAELVFGNDIIFYLFLNLIMKKKKKKIPALDI